MKKNKNNKFFKYIVVILLIIGYYYSTYNQETYSNKGTNKTKEISKEVSTSLNIYYIDVGQGDSILITNKDHSMLIDAGNNEDGKLLVSYIKDELNINKIDYVIGTHPHEDHIGGLDDIINNIEVSEVYLPEAMTTTKTFEDVLDAIENNNLNITVPKIGDKFSLGDLNFEVIYTGTGTKDLNEASIILKMTFGNHTYLFTGDTTKEVESTILNNNIDIDVLKVAHHGSNTSTSEEFLSVATPEYAIISVGEDNKYGHPNQETINRLKKYTKNIYITKDLGTIVLTSDGDNININSYITNTDG